MKIFDPHAHYDDEAFDEDREEVLKEIRENGVIGLVDCGASLESSKKSLELAEKYDFIYTALGIHPENAFEVNNEALELFEKLSKNPKVKAIGEIGLDYHSKENPSRDLQKEAFRKQMELAKKLNLPVIIHDRDAHADTMEILRDYKGNVKGEVHCFSGSIEMAKECLELGYYIGFTGVLTFKNAGRPLEVAKYVPLDRILLETDCPYMAPTPYRGTRNRSDYIKLIISKLAEIKGIPEEELSKKLIENAASLLKIEL